MHISASFDCYPAIWDTKKGMYAWLNPTSSCSNALMGLLRDAPFKTFNSQEMHCTVIHCAKNTPLPDYGDIYLPNDGIRMADAYHITHWVDHKDRNILVMELNSDDLQELHKELTDLGFVHSFKEGYNPHITLAKDVDMNADTRMWIDAKNARLEDYPIPIQFNPEIFVTSQE